MQSEDHLKALLGVGVLKKLEDQGIPLQHVNQVIMSVVNCLAESDKAAPGAKTAPVDAPAPAEGHSSEKRPTGKK